MTECMFNVTDYGAVGDGATMNTAAIQRAVDACAEAGGGRVVVPAGVFVTAPIFLRSNVEFHLGAGAVLRGSREMDDYPLLDNESHGYHIDHWLHASLLTGYMLENVAITGTGTLDGQGDVWWQARDNGTLAHIRPSLIYLCDCERALIDGVKLTSAPSYNILPLFCRNLTINNVTIKNPWKPYFNCDGIDLYSCNNVRIANCYIDTGDDGICLKTVPEDYLVGTGTVDYGKPRVPCENVIVENCVVEHGHSGVALWAELVGGIRNVVVSNCVFDGTRSGIRIARYPWPGGYVRDVRVNNIVMRRVEWVIEVNGDENPNKFCTKPDDAAHWEEHPPEFSNLHFSNITAIRARVACDVSGSAAQPIHDISFSNLQIEADMGFTIRHVHHVLLDNVTVTSRGVPLVAQDATDLELRRFNASVSTPELPVLQCERVRDTWVHGCTAACGTEIFLGHVGDVNTVQMESNRLEHAARAEAPVASANAWNICTHAYSGSRMIRDTGERNPWLPVTAAVMDALRCRWTPEQIDRIYSVARVEANARNGAEVDNPHEKRRIYIIEAHDVTEKLAIFEDGELLRTVSDPHFHAHTWELV